MTTRSSRGSMSNGGRSALRCEQRSEGRAALRLAEHEHLAHARLPGRLLRLLGTGWYRHKVARAGVLELGAQLRHGVERADRGVDASQQRDRVKRDRVFGNVRAVDRKDVALAESARGQSCRDPPHALRPTAIGERAAARSVDERGFVAALPRHARAGTASAPPRGWRQAVRARGRSSRSFHLGS